MQKPTVSNHHTEVTFMCDQKDISLETAAQIVIAGLQSGQIKLPCANCFDEKDKQKQVEKRVAVLQGGDRAPRSTGDE